MKDIYFARASQHSALSTQHSALSTQHSALSTQHSALSTQHSALSTNTGGSRPARRLTLFACPNRVSRKKAPCSLPACGGYPPLRNRRAGGKDSLRSVLRPFRPPAAPFRRRHKGNNGNAVIRQFSSAGVCNSLPPTLANHLRCAKALRSGNGFDCMEEYDSGCRLRRQSW
jgi:hypothetical protein